MRLVKIADVDEISGGRCRPACRKSVPNTVETFAPGRWPASNRDLSTDASPEGAKSDARFGRRRRHEVAQRDIVHAVRAATSAA